MKKLFLLISVLNILLLTSCSKNPPQPDNSSNNNPGNSPVQYKFSSPQIVQVLNNPERGFIQYATIKENITLTSYITQYNIQNNGTYVAYASWYLKKNGSTEQKAFQVTTPKLSHHPSIPCFDIDATGSVLFVIIDQILYKYNLSSSTTNPTPLKVAQNIGEVSALKALSQNEVILSTDLQNGSLLKIRDNGTTQTIATNLINPGIFDIYNNEYYVVEKNPTGSVKKVSINGNVNNILSNLNLPYNLSFDKNGNFILQTQWTTALGTYQVYELYTAAGKKISDITDNSNNRIVTGYNISMPLYVDTYNNLFFSHNALVNSGGLTYCNPNSPQMGIWKLQMIKQ